jgi:small-conductance mechanosensitive channel
LQRDTTVDLFHIRLLGVNAENGRRLLLTVAIIAGVIVLRYLIVGLVRLVTGEKPNERLVFWTRQGASVATAVLAALALISVWFEDSGRLGTMAGLIGAGLAFALQKVVTAFAGYLVILRGKTFTVGDRITMGGVRGDVVALTFLQTRIMEMGAPPSTQTGDNPSWVYARQYTGRIVTVTNDKVFDQPVYNYTREFPYMWEELRIPISYKTDRRKAEEILIACAKEATTGIREDSGAARRKIEDRYFIDLGDLEPRVFVHLTDNWIELQLRFLTPIRGIRSIVDDIQRRLLDRFEAARIEIASGTYAIVELPPVRVEGAAVDRIAAALHHASASTPANSRA